ncbi:GGDEF domain-containing protein [Paraglaciecola sp. 20A4]|uniref:GGDEF domain-containing protein n=1 Tax=Paraglaciecola sp. 20A4 TaxID=2687288 RepID=UPI00140A79E7|nr:GGDEF domain-containing protein [Paraglaciecola sp. 20A4]
MTIYIPTLICIPIVLWYGYLWGAIVAYLASFTVALVGGMPLYWALIFAFSNPLGLLMYSLFYRVSQLRTDMRGSNAIVGFVLISLLASLAGSTGSFIWTHTNQIGIHQTFAVWQGWWLGEWLHSLLIVLPILYFSSSYVQAWLHPLKDKDAVFTNTRKTVTVAISSLLVVLVGYVLTARMFSVKQAEEAIKLIDQPLISEHISNAVDGMSYPLFVLIVVMLAMAFLGYQVVLYFNRVLLAANEKLSEQNITLESLANVDSLTGIFNRRKAMEFFELEFLRAKRTQKWLCVMMLDVDHFKSINDTFGHLVGDEVLVDIAKQVKANLRPYDLAGRYGGEEFILVLPSTSLDEAVQVGERIRQTIKDAIIEINGLEIHVTMSIGISSYHEDDSNSAQSLTRADDALFRAKRAGRNCVVF